MTNGQSGCLCSASEILATASAVIRPEPRRFPSIWCAVVEHCLWLSSDGQRKCDAPLGEGCPASREGCSTPIV